ncbi:hypothetical protein M1L60_10870 [Actinoplanes sp. TRM 88003]|uniref:Uncharacterized protein n=1 Tax=Paractinoplanes aksuensis TaxID=2939490 RepID=A0ABT1DJX3_9ACTN|nr:hypothetical protein [Actinoplanes aksuensis]MCO8271095.1 hypothetical protein [Actinoplanes aksuensis]
MRDETVDGGELEQLLQGDQHARRRWLDRRPQDANWWLYLLLLIEAEEAQHPEWAELTVWVLAEAGRRSVLDRAEIAERTAYYVARLREAGTPPMGLPSADAVVRACLDAIPVALDEVALLSDRRDLRRLERRQMLDSRRARLLLNAAERHRAHLVDSELADRLGVWLAVKPRLV